MSTPKPVEDSGQGIDPLFDSRPTPTHDLNDAPPWYSVDEASAWLAGWNAAIDAMKKATTDAE